METSLSLFVVREIVRDFYLLTILCMLFLPTWEDGNSAQLDGDGFPTWAVIATDTPPEIEPITLSDTELKWIEHCLGVKPEERMLDSEISAVEAEGKRVINIQISRFIDFRRRREIEKSLQEVFEAQKSKLTEWQGRNHFYEGDYLFHIITGDTENKEQFERERRRIEDHVVVALEKLLHEAGITPLEIRIRPTRMVWKIQRFMMTKWNLVLDILTKKWDGGNQLDVQKWQAIVRDFIGQINSPAIDRIVGIHIHEVNPHIAAFKEEEAARRRQHIHAKAAQTKKNKLQPKPVSS